MPCRTTSAASTTDRCGRSCMRRSRPRPARRTAVPVPAKPYASRAKPPARSTARRSSRARRRRRRTPSRRFASARLCRHHAAHMSAATVIYLLVRVLHVLLAAIWVGVAAFVAYFLFPVIEETGPSNGPAMRLLARRLPVATGAIGGITVLPGFWLYWRFPGGFDPALAGSMGRR